MQEEKPKILVVCGRNKRRSRTAEYIFKNDSRFLIRSAGVSEKSDVQVNEKLLSWADLIFVMDNSQRNRIQSQYKHLDLPEFENLNIEDEYEYLDPVLAEMLTSRMNEALKTIFSL